MKVGDIITAPISSVHFRVEERKQIGATYGVYGSYFVAKLSGYTEGIVVVDALAQKMHPDWEKKTRERANILTQELSGKSVRVRVIEVIRDEIFEAELLELIK